MAVVVKRSGQYDQLFPDESGGRQGLTSTTLDFALTYEGKRSERDILSQPATTKFRPVLLSGESPSLNSFYYGDNGESLRLLLEDPEVCGKVKLVYIDPPYGTGQVFRGRNAKHAYHDTLSGAAFLEFLRERLILLRELLAEDGSIYVHLDNAMAPAIKLIMDEVFGPKNFRNWITRRKSNAKNYTSRQYGNMQDYILFYSKGKNPVWNRPYEDERIYTLEQRFPRIDEATGRRYALVPVHARGRRNGATGGEWRGKLPPEGKHWQYHPDKLDEFDRQGDIYWSPTGNPRRKIWADESNGVTVQDIWMEFKDAHNQNVKITGYPTEKNLDLLRRIVATSSNPGDLVLDCFAGSGTTLVAAQELGRQWIGADTTSLSRFVMLERLLEKSSVVVGTQSEPRKVGLFDVHTVASTQPSFILSASIPWQDDSDQAPKLMVDYTGTELGITQPEDTARPLGLVLVSRHNFDRFIIEESVLLQGRCEATITLPASTGSCYSVMVFATDGTAWNRRIDV